jgi:hypothetical protein
MTCVAKNLRTLWIAALLCGASTMSYAQQVDDGLRLETMTGDGDVVLPPTPPKYARITIGDDDPPVPRRARKKTENPYAAQGVRTGAFLLYPSIEIGSIVTTNVRKATSRPKADVGLRLRPTLRFESDWSRHSLSGSASFEGEQFLDNSDIKSRNGNAQAALRLDIRRTTKADIDWSYSATSTGLESNELPLTATGSRLDQSFSAAAAITHDFGGVEGRLRLGLSRSLYGDVDLTGGGTEDNSDRDYTQASLSARVGLKTGGILQPYVDAAYEPRLHDKKIDRNGLRRDSQGLRFATGLAVTDDPIWSGDVAATLELRDYSDDSLETVLAPGVAANLTWRPTDLTRFEFNANTSLAEAASAGVSATQNWTFGVKATHSLRENLELVSGLRGEFEKTNSDTDVTTIGNVGVNWTINPFVVLSAGYEGTFFNSATPGNDYQDHRLLTSIILRR